MEENKATLKMFMLLASIALVAMLLVSSVALVTMQMQSQNAVNKNVEMFRLYMESDYDYGTITQSTDVNVGEE